MPNHLADQQSAYLRSAKDQPVEWHPWSNEAFERARNEDKPILLDIGAVWCHWCHVMDHESYEDPAVARVLNSDWICIKVDRDERPDVDTRYQRAVQLLTGQGGWPLTAFLTPEGAVFYGGTYFPPDGRHGRPGFQAVLTSLARLYRERPEDARQQAVEIARHLAMHQTETLSGTISPTILSKAAEGMARLADARNGGFGSQPKFPHPAACDFLLARWFDTREPSFATIVLGTLDAMGRGGMRDHLGGGFHRYSVDAQWIVPHFEKMLYDNAELLRAYVHAANTPTIDPQHPPAERYRDVIEGVVAWIMDTMADPAGGYYASQDADVGLEDDGDYFTWTIDEARAVLDADEFEVLRRHFDIEESGEMRHDPRRNVLWAARTLDEIADDLAKTASDTRGLLDSGRQKLRRVRDARRAPFVDPTVYTAWNAMMVSAMLEASATLNRPALERHALTTLERLFQDAQDGAGPGLRHALGSELGGILDDQVQAAATAIDAFEVTGESPWLTRAEDLMTHVWEAYRSESGGLRDTPREQTGEGFLVQEMRPIQDTPTPSPNGVAGIVLARLHAHTDDDAWRARRDELLGTFAGAAAELSIFGATLLRAIDWAVMPSTHVVIVGPDNPETRELLRAARSTYRPRLVLRWLTPDGTTDSLPVPIQAMLDGSFPRAYVCSGVQCAAPAAAPEELATTLQTFAVG
jgi:uncharacterized protein YyaL (SSP411 family)